VVYNGQPLYYWSRDKVPGDVTGDGIGGIWSVARP
jgi:predicted lipoprotein with Yx(FWY)xxD motif